ncbi:hypothetical protein G6O46_23060, partial [Salmonella enterica subsp. enterica serovar Enteritidis]|uniref:hypothetical protein n=1 Tax=Salmonella enterica TaxID=28901 RepID=UPI0018C8880A
DDHHREGNEAQGAGHFDPVRVTRDVVKDVGNATELRRRRLTARLDSVLLHPLVGPVLFIGIMALLFAAVFLVADPASSLMDKLIGLARVQLTGLLGKN